MPARSMIAFPKRVSHVSSYMLASQHLSRTLVPPLPPSLCAVASRSLTVAFSQVC